MYPRHPFAAAVLAASSLAAGTPAPTPAWAQSNLDAGKSPATIYAQGCGACHGTPHDLHVIRRDFLMQHYTTGPEQARLLADYIEAVRSEPRPVKPRRSPRAEIDVADVEATGSIGAVQPAALPSETAMPDAVTPDELPSEMAPPDIDE